LADERFLNLNFLIWSNKSKHDKEAFQLHNHVERTGAYNNQRGDVEPVGERKAAKDIYR